MSDFLSKSFQIHGRLKTKTVEVKADLAIPYFNNMLGLTYKSSRNSSLASFANFKFMSDFKFMSFQIHVRLKIGFEKLKAILKKGEDKN